VSIDPYELTKDRLLDSISLVLTGHTFRPLGAPQRNPANGPSRDLSHLQPPGTPPADVQALALHVLGTFDFSGHTLNEFVRDAILPYLEHDNMEVRQEAVLASTQLFIHDPICFQTSSHSIEIVSDVLEKLLTVGITDPSEYIKWAS
jgi:FKBP12-rapamycin complex-associated protein